MSVTVVGAEETAADLEQIGRGLEELPALPALATVMVNAARSVVRHRTGRLAGTIRSTADGTHAAFLAGGSLPYARVQEAGGYHGITPNHYVRGAYLAAIGAAQREVDSSIRGLIRAAGQ